MGCKQSNKVQTPQQKAEFHRFNTFMKDEYEQSVYSVLEYWYCCNYSQAERVDHIHPINLSQQLELKKDYVPAATKEQTCIVPSNGQRNANFKKVHSIDQIEVKQQGSIRR